jgi:preprotein translocase subunit SecG
MKRLLLLGMVALGTVLLLASTSAAPVAAYGGEASATMSCTDNTSTMTRTVVVTVTWTGGR